jgi:basic membrane protein A and related proteins
MFHTLILALGLVTATLSAAPLKVGLALDKGGRDDKSFNSAAFKGVTDAEKKLGIQVKVVESSDDSGIEPSLRTFAQKGFDLVIGIGFIMGDPMKKIAAQFPNTKFLIVDSVVDLPNVRSITFKEHEGSYLVGYIAALTSKTGKVGFVGGMDVPLIRRFEMGYKAGAKAANPKTEVISNYVGSSSDAWRNPTRGKELATSQFGKGVDVTFAAAGASGLGVFDAAEEKKKFAIGVDSNQNWVKPGRILTSMLKRVDLAVYDTVEKTTKGQFKGGVMEWGFKDGAIDFAMDEHNRAILTPEVEKKANEIKNQISSGKVSVPDYYKINKTKS